MVYWNEPRPLNYEKPTFHQSKLCWKGSCVLKSVFWSRRSTSRWQTSVCDPSKTRAQTVAYLHDETWELSATVTKSVKVSGHNWTGEQFILGHTDLLAFSLSFQPNLHVFLAVAISFYALASITRVDQWQESAKMLNVWVRAWNIS